MSRSRRRMPPTDESLPDRAAAAPVDPAAAGAFEPASPTGVEHERGEMTSNGPAMASPPVTEPPRPSAPQEPARRRSGWVPALLGGLIGGLVVALAGAWYVTTQPFVPPVLTARLEALEAERARLDAVTSETASLRERSEAAVSSIGSLQGRVAGLEQAGAAAPERIGTLERTVTELRERLEGTRATTDTVAGDVRGRLEELRAEVDRIAGEMREVAQASGAAGAAGARLDAVAGAQESLSGEIARLGGAFDQLRADAESGRQGALAAQESVRQELAGLRADLEAVAGRQEALQQLTATVATLQRAGGAREAEIARAHEEIAALQQGLEQRLAQFEQEREQSLEEAQIRVTERAAAIERASAMALAAYELRVALERGGGVEPTVAMLRETAGVVPGLDEIAQSLSAAAEEGVPTLAELRQGLDEVASAAQQARSEAAAPQGWLGQAQQNLGGLVQMRPSDQTEPATADAVGEARAALADGDLAAAKAAVAPLAEAGNAVASAWIAAAERRQAVAAAADELAARLQTSLASQ